MNDKTTDSGIWSEDLGQTWRTIGTLGALLAITVLFVGAFLAFGYVMHLVFYPGTGVFVPDWQVRLATLFGMFGIFMFAGAIARDELHKESEALTAEEVEDGVDA